MECTYNLTELPEGTVLMHEGNRNDDEALKWSGAYPIPQIGDRVKVKINSLGRGVVEHYFREHGYVGVQVRLENDPAWHVKQCKGDWHAGLALVFGVEIEH